MEKHKKEKAKKDKKSEKDKMVAELEKRKDVSAKDYAEKWLSNSGDLRMERLDDLAEKKLEDHPSDNGSDLETVHSEISPTFQDVEAVKAVNPDATQTKSCPAFEDRQ